MKVDLAVDPAALTHVLGMLSMNDTKVVSEGEKMLKPFLKQPTCIPSLINQIRTNPDEKIRFHASLLLKKSVGKLLKKFSPAQVQDLKGQFLVIMTSEPTKNIGVALAGVVANVAKNVFASEGNWPELFTLLMQLAQDQKEMMRSLNYSLLEQVRSQIKTCE
jgi:hypothetical protein